MTNVLDTDRAARYYMPQEPKWSQLHFRAILDTWFPALGVRADHATTLADLAEARRVAAHCDLHNAIQNHRVGDGGLFGVALQYHWREMDGDDKVNQHMKVVASLASKVWPFPRPGDPTVLVEMVSDYCPEHNR